jgi:hypothetical protein
MNRVWLLLGIGLVGMGILAACDKSEDGGSITDPPGTGGGSDIPDGIALARNIDPLLANGIDETEIFVTVVDSRRRALADVGVSFTTTAGTIEPFATTNAQGVATTLLRSVASSTDVNAVVRAATTVDSLSGAPLPGDTFVLLTGAPLSQELLDQAFDIYRLNISPGVASLATDIADQVTIPMLGVTLTLDATPTILPADGSSTSRIRASLVETTTRIPLSNQSVRFGASVGAITGRVNTDASGTATALLTSTDGGATSEITAFYGDLLTAQVTVAFSSLTLTLHAGLPGIEPNGGLVTPITATLINAENNPVGGVTIEFTTDQGTISSPAVTGEDGTASVVLRTPPGATGAGINARFGDLTATLAVPFEPFQFAVTSGSPSIRADGSSNTTVRAYLATSDNDPLPGVRITFKTTLGTVTPAAETGEDGFAVATLASGTAPGEAVVTASYAKDKSASTTVQFVGAPEPSSLTLTAGSTTVLADGLASTQITATVTDPQGNPPPAGTVVTFTTTRGKLDNILPTNEAGQATARLAATRFETGLARVTGALGDLTQTIDIAFTSESASQIVVLEVDQPTIGVRGSGTLETSVVTYEVRDANGIPVDADHAATLTFRIVPLSGEIDATVHPVTAVTNEDGAVIATVQSGVVSGAIELEASSGNLVSKPIRIAIHGGLPDPDHFSVSSEFLNIAGLVYDGIRNGITARVGDFHGNPVPQQTAVWFESAFGLVQGSAGTDDHGEATVWEISAGPRPLIPGGDGLVLITAQTVSADGDILTTSTNVMWSGPTILQITAPQAGFAIPNGGSVNITFTVRDANNNPLTGGTSISVEANAGTVGGTSSFTLPDTQSQSYTTFTAVLSDDDAAESDPPTSVTILVSVGSQNGNRQASVTGTID